jgi:ATP-binding cassette subfamily F protein 3
MALLRLSRISKTYGSDEVLRDVSFEVRRGEKIGLVGSNGSGKTTIFRIALGEIEPTGGDVTTARNLRMSYMPQAVETASSLGLRDYVLEARAAVHRIEEEIRAVEEAVHHAPGDEKLLRRLGALGQAFDAEGGYRIGAECDAILAGLGFEADRHAMPLDRMSGGERTKAALARILLESSDLLLLDEPTNHLDIWAATWLEEFLLRSPAACVIVSHDRYFLDRVAGSIVELTGGRTTSYRGNYTAFCEQRAQRRLADDRAYERQQEHIRKEEDFIRRYHYGQRSREARGRRKKLERIERVEKQAQERTLSLRLGKATRKSNNLVRLAGVAKAFGDRELFRDVDFTMVRGDRMGLIGPNGAGKTTFLRLVMGEEAPTAGTVTRGAVSPGYYDQHQRSLADENTLLDELAAVRPDLTVGQLRGAAGRFLFSGEDAFKTVAALSGGEKARLALAKLVLSAPSFLVLDEPTNHLDIHSREAVEEALAAYDGSVLLVTHDRRLLDAVADTLLVLRNGRLVMFPGDYSQWRSHVEEEEARQRRNEEARARGAARLGDAEAFRQEQKERERRRRRRQRELAEVERRIEALEARRGEILALFEDPAVYDDPPRVAALTAENKQIAAELEGAYHRWEELERAAAEAGGDDAGS